MTRGCSLKLMAGPAPHTQLDADLAAGMGMPDNGPKLMSMIFFLVTINIKKGRSIIGFAHLLGCIIVGLMGLIVEIPLYTAIAIVKSPYLLFKHCQTLIHDLISREGPFLKTACIPIAGLTILMWPLIVIESIIMAIFSSIFIGLYGSVIVYQEHSFRRGLAYVISMVAEFDEYINDWLYLREGSILPKPQYRKKILPSSDPSIVVQAMAPKQPNTGLFVGLNRGHIVTKKEFAPRPSDRKGKTSKRTIFVRNLIRENI